MVKQEKGIKGTASVSNAHLFKVNSSNVLISEICWDWESLNCSGYRARTVVFQTLGKTIPSHCLKPHCS